jgi:hypothetical protein
VPASTAVALASLAWRCAKRVLAASPTHAEPAAVSDRSVDILTSESGKSTSATDCDAA